MIRMAMIMNPMMMIRIKMAVMSLEIWPGWGYVQSKDEEIRKLSVSVFLDHLSGPSMEWDFPSLWYGLDCLMMVWWSGDEEIRSSQFQFDEVFRLLRNSLVMMTMNEICSNQIWKKSGSCPSVLSWIVAINAPGWRSDRVFGLCGNSDNHHFRMNRKNQKAV